MLARRRFRRGARPAVPGRAVQIPVATAIDDGFVDELTLEPAGLARVFGWWRGALDDLQARLALILDGAAIPATRAYRLLRPDVEAGHAEIGAGFAVEVLLEERECHHVVLRWRGDRGVRDLAQASLAGWHVVAPPYAHLLRDPPALDRNGIYGSGPPVAEVAEDVLTAIRSLARGRVLDYGCGRGSLLEHLLADGVDAYGLELDVLAIRSTLPSALAERVTLYDGSPPAPFEDASFDTVVSVEVLEHVEAYERVIADVARLTRGSFVLTTPDLSAIPLLHRHHVVPWHLLEATHVSFFTHDSLAAVLSRHFHAVESFRILPNRVNDTVYYSSLLAVCSKPRR